MTIALDHSQHGQTDFGGRVHEIKTLRRPDLWERRSFI
jgi:hypothetical protein